HHRSHCFTVLRQPPGSPLFPYTTLFRSCRCIGWICWPSLRKRNRMRWPTFAVNGAVAGNPLPLSVRPPSCSFRTMTSSLSYLGRSEEHTSELQSRSDLVCRLLLEKKKTH